MGVRVRTRPQADRVGTAATHKHALPPCPHDPQHLVLGAECSQRCSNHAHLLNLSRCSYIVSTPAAEACEHLVLGTAAGDCVVIDADHGGSVVFRLPAFKHQAVSCLALDLARGVLLATSRNMLKVGACVRMWGEQVWMVLSYKAGLGVQGF